MLALRPVKALPKNGSLCMLQFRSKYLLPSLPYKLSDMEPIISSEIMELHYSKHHKTYVSNLNNLLVEAQEAIEKNNLEHLIKIKKDINFNGGGHLNHSILWTNLCPPHQCKPPNQTMLSIIMNSFGSYDNLTHIMSNTAIGIQGSGWAWLGFNPVTGKLEVKACQNQDPLQPTTGLVPLLGIDVWEHAYYLQYKNARAQYVKKIWEIINWNDVLRRYNEATKIGKGDE